MNKKIFQTRRLKSALCIALAGMMMMGVCGCGKNGGTDNAVAEAKVLSGGTTFAETDFNFTTVEEVLESAVMLGDHIYYISLKLDGDSASSGDAYNVTTTLSKVDINSGEITNISQLTPEDGSYLSNIIKGADGNIYLFKAGVYEDTQILCKIVDDKLEEDVELNSIQNDSDSYYAVDLVDKNGNFVMTSEDGLRICDRDSNDKFSKQLQNSFIFGCANTKDGDIAVYMESYENDSTTNQIMIIGTDSYEVKKEVSIEEQLSYNDPLMEGIGDYDLLYKSKSALFGYNLADESSTKIVEFDASNINTDNCTGIYMIDSKTFIADESEYLDDACEEGTFTFKKYSNENVVDESGKTIITYAVLYADPDLKDDVIEFNKSQSDYTVKIVDYGEEADPDAKISADIAAGNFADIYDLKDGLGDVSMNQAIEKGLFEDLTPYIEKDADVSLDDLIPSVKDAIDMDGKCYFLPASFAIYALVSRESDMGSELQWTCDELIDYCNSKPDSRLFYSGKKTDALYGLLDGCGNEFIDWESGECNFNNQDFKNILELANKGSDKELEDLDDYETESYRDGTIMFCEGSLELDSLSEINALYEGDYGIKGYPSSDNTGITIALKRMAAISSQSKNKEAAWEFVRRYITEDYQGEHYPSFWGNPTRQDVYDVKCEALQATKKTKDKYGNKIIPKDGEFGLGDLVIEEKPYSDEDISTYTTAVENASGLWSNDRKVEDIIVEEAEAYFAGDKSVDEVVEIIENRVNTYINENR